MRRLSARYSAYTSGQKGPGLRLPSSLLRLCRLQAAASNWRRVLPNGGQSSRVQG